MFARKRSFLIKVSSKTNPKKLALALYHAMEESNGDDVIAQAIGVRAVNQLVKGVAIARGMAAPKGYKIAVEPFFADLVTESGTVSGIRMRIIAC